MRPWYTGIGPPPGVFRTPLHEIGLAGFAGVAGRNEYYFEWQFGGTFGRGSTYTEGEDGRLHIVANVYIS
jgi:hypothetical protein